MTKTIQLSKNMFTIIDDCDYQYVSKYKWYYSSSGYAARTTPSPKKNILLHRELLGVKPGLYGDHINGNKLDNRRSNLRIVTFTENCQHYRPRKTNTTGVSGVHKSKGMYYATMNFGWNMYLGSFRELQDAIDCRRTMEKVCERLKHGL